MAATVAPPAPSSNEKRSSSAGQRWVFLAPWPVRPGAGVNNVILGLRDAMSAQYQPEIVVTGWDTEPEPNQKSLRLTAAALPLRRFLGFCFRLIPDVVRLIALTRGAAVFNPHYFGTEILPLAVLRKLGLLPQLILSVHGADVTAAAAATPWERTIYSLICRSADAVIACSGALAEEVHALSPRANVLAVWNGVSAPPEHLGGRPLPAPYLVSVAAFVKKKGHDVLIEAFRQIAPEFPGLKLVLVGGDGPERANVEQWIRAAGLEDRIDCAVNLEHEEVWTWVHHAECFVHAAREEPFGIAVLEAALVHTPVVTTTVGGIREYLTDGVEGLTCEPDDPEQLAARIRQTLADPAAAHARATAFYEKARQFTWQAAWSRYRDIARL